MLVDDCKQLLPSGFVFQQDEAPALTARQTQWLKVNCNGFFAKDQWPPNSPDLNPLDYHVWGVNSGRLFLGVIFCLFLDILHRKCTSIFEFCCHFVQLCRHVTLTL